MSSLDLGMIGNCTISALIDRTGTVVWSCFPRFDGDPLFCKLLDDDNERGFYSVELDGLVQAEQHYLQNTAVLITKLTDGNGDGIEIADFCPRFLQFGRIFRPTTIMRLLRPFGETPRIASACGRPSTTARTRRRSRAAATTSATSAPTRVCGSRPTHR
jgi:Domain of unknown function (DUF5911)